MAALTVPSAVVHSGAMRATFFGVMVAVVLILVASATILSQLGSPPETVTPSGVAETERPTAAPEGLAGSGAAGSPGSEPTSSAEPTTGADGSADNGSPDVGLRVGQKAPALIVARLGGGTIDLAELRGGPVWVNFTASWCPTCRDELSLMERFQAALEDELTIVVVDVREDEATVTALVEDVGVTLLPFGLDEDGSVQQEWGAYALPVHYWVDGEGIVRGFVFGGAGPEQFLEGVRSVLPDAEIEL